METKSLDATSAASIGATMEHIGQQMRTQATAYAERTGLMRGSMNAVSLILMERADSFDRMAHSLRYDEPHGLRHALDVHVNLLRDLADELTNPGSTKYSPRPVVVESEPAKNRARVKGST